MKLASPSLLVKLVVAFIIALMPVLALIIWGFRADVHRSEEAVLQNHILAANAVAMHVEETFTTAISVGWAVANDPLALNASATELNTHLHRLVRQDALFESIAVFDITGHKRGAASREGGAEMPQDVHSTSYFQAVAATNSPIVSEVMKFSDDNTHFGIVVAVPLRGGQDRLKGVVTVALNASLLAKFYDESRLQAGQDIYLVDRTGRLAFHSSKRNLRFDQTLAYADFDPVRRALAGAPQTFTHLSSPFGARPRIGAAVPTSIYHWVIGVGMPRSVALAPAREAMLRYSLGFGVSLVLSIAIAVLVASHLTSPLSLLRTNAIALGRGDLSRRVKVDTGDEIEDLADAVNAMAEQIQDRDKHLRATQERFRATFEQAAVGIAHFALDGRCLRVNQRLCSLLGYSREELLKKISPDITFKEDVPREIELRAKTVKGELETFVVEKRYIRKNGSLVWANATVSLARTTQGEPEYFIVVIEDIEHRKQMEEDRAQLLQREQTARAAAEAASHAKDRFLAVVSHELRTPLTPVMAALDLVTQEPNLTEEAVEALEMIRENVQTEARLIGDLLDLTRIQQAKFELKREIVDAHSILRFVMNFFSREIETKQLKIGLQLDARDSTLFADAGRLQQVFWNLLSNAVKFTPESGSITVSTSSDSEKLKIQVADTGIGITPETMSRLFNAFEQGEQTLSRRYGGLGLGLSISKTLVEIQGGTIKASSEGKGAVFTVELPLAAAQGRPAPLPLPISPKARTQPIRLQPDHKEITKAENGGYDILLVEDNRDTLHTLSRLLQRAGYRVSCATTAREAIQLEKSKRHDLLLSDIGLPDASGWEMLLELRKISPRIAAVAMSGYGAPEDTEKSRQAGFYEHLVKPVNYQNLRAVLERAPICSGAWLDS